MGNYKARHIESKKAFVSNQNEEINALRQENEFYRESYNAIANAALEFDNIGWSSINTIQGEGFSLMEAQKISKSLREQTVSNPLLKRGSMLRSTYVFGRGFKMSSNNNPLPPRFRQIVDDPINQLVLFGEAACKQNERTLFSSGNFFVSYNKRTRQFSRVPLSEVESIARDPENPEIIRYILRNYVRETVSSQNTNTTVTNVREWYPMDYTDKPITRIGNVRVNRDVVLIDLRVNNDQEATWGVPDALPAMPWAWAYSEYLKDGSKMLKALSSIAWQVKSKSAKGASNASAKLLNNRQVAATAVTGADVELSALPRNNSVDLATGKPLASMAATAMEVSVDALLSDGSEAMTLDQPTLNAAYGRQGDWEGFFVRVLSVIGVPNPTVQFNKIVVDPSYRSVQSLGQAWMTGLFDPEVIHAAYAEELGIDAPGVVPDGVLVPNNEFSIARADIDTEALMRATTVGSGTTGNQTNVASSQGNPGAGIDDLSDGDQTLRDIQNIPR
jgi:hypothetical protein